MRKLRTALCINFFLHFSSGIVSVYFFFVEKFNLWCTWRINYVFIFVSRPAKVCEPFSKLEFFQVNFAFRVFCIHLEYKTNSIQTRVRWYTLLKISVQARLILEEKLVSVVYCLVLYSNSFSFGESSLWEDYFVLFLSFIMAE